MTRRREKSFAQTIGDKLLEEAIIRLLPWVVRAILVALPVLLVLLAAAVLALVWTGVLA